RGFREPFLSVPMASNCLDVAVKHRAIGYYSPKSVEIDYSNSTASFGIFSRQANRAIALA
ncbi:hypothetical protein, partial [Mesorhizobium sp. M2A.F.Ca.ET.039.01.1.1]|uniref:hypothetical protein n=1 Tax=Mesorhizobium sp. M2A.F.Ca.ET.039.01.1.1 TaxID=2496746 RepID=UPI001AEC76D8